MIITGIIQMQFGSILPNLATTASIRSPPPTIRPILPTHNVSIFDAVRTENLEALRCRLISADGGGNVTSRNKDLHDVIYWATWFRKLSVLQYLLDEVGFPLNDKSPIGWTLLHFAAYHSDMDGMNYLVERGADVGIRDLIGNTPLHYAVSANLPPSATAQYLVEAGGADINGVDWFKNSPAHLAASANNLPALTYLASAGAALELKNSLGFTPLHLTIKWGVADGKKIEILRYLMSEGVNLTSVDWKGNTPLHSAAENCDLETISFLRQNGADVNAANDDGDTPLHTAGKSGCNLRVIEKLVNIGANLGAENRKGKSPVNLVPAGSDVFMYLERVINERAEVGTSTTQATIASTTPLPPPPVTSTPSTTLKEDPNLQPNCTDNSFFANCKLVVKASYCSNKYYARFCCKSCSLEGQLPLLAGVHVLEGRRPN